MDVLNHQRQRWHSRSLTASISQKTSLSCASLTLLCDVGYAKRYSLRLWLCVVDIAVSTHAGDSQLFSVCSQCLRNHLVYATQHHFDVCCPDCRKEFCEGDIQSLVTFCASVALYKDARQILLDAFVHSPRHAPSPEGSLVGIACSASTDQCREDIIVPPKLHMNSVNATQLRKRLAALSIPTEGNKHVLANRYRAFRTFVQVEKDKGIRRSMDALAKEFQKQEKDKKSQAPSMKLDVFCQTKTHLDLVREIREREKGSKASLKK